jgi:adenylate cyclase
MMTAWHFSFHPSSLAGRSHMEKEATSLEMILVKGEQKRLWFLSTNSPEASEYCLRGWDDYYRFTSEANAQARQMFARAVALDPQYAAAYASLGWTYWLDWMWFWSQDPQNLEQAFVLAQKSLDLNGALPASHLLLSRIYLVKKQHDQAIAEAERAIVLDSTCADCYVTLADILTFAGRPQEAFGLVEKAMRLAPFSTSYYEATLGRTYYLLERYEEAITTLKRALIRNPSFLANHLNLAIAYSEIGREEEAHAELAESQKLSPHLSLEGLRQRIPHKDPQTVERLLNALRKAGLN